jgi:hypothetical protein
MPDLPTDPVPKPLQSVSFLREEMIKTMEGVSKKRSSINFLQLLGGGLLVVAFFVKLLPQRWISWAAILSESEFITVVLVATLFILAGSAMRLYQFHKEQDAARHIRDFGVELVSKTMDDGKG